MTLSDLCQRDHHKHFVEIVLYYQPGREAVKPFIVGFGERQLTRLEWGELARLVQAWYSSTTDVAIELHNAQEEQSLLERPVSTMTKPRDRQRDGWIYVLQGDRFFKIGQAVSVDSRVKQIEPTLPFPLEVVCQLRVDDMNAVERALHDHFADKRVGGEWFLLDEADIEYIRSLAARKDAD